MMPYGNRYAPSKLQDVRHFNYIYQKIPECVLYHMLKYKYQMWTFTGCWHVILSLHSGGSFPRSTLYDKIKGIIWLCIYLILSYYAYFDFMISALCYITSTMAQWHHLVTYIWVNLAQVMACCLMAPSHYLNQCWLIINHPRPVSQESLRVLICKMSLKIHLSN